MVLAIPINSDTEAKLRRQAQAAGKDVTAYVTQIVEQAAARPGIDELLSPLRKEFARLGTSNT